MTVKDSASEAVSNVASNVASNVVSSSSSNTISSVAGSITSTISSSGPMGLLAIAGIGTAIGVVLGSMATAESKPPSVKFRAVLEQQAAEHRASLERQATIDRDRIFNVIKVSVKDAARQGERSLRTERTPLNRDQECLSPSEVYRIRTELGIIVNSATSRDRPNCMCELSW